MKKTIHILILGLILSLDINAQSTSPDSAQPKLRLGIVEQRTGSCGSRYSLNSRDLWNDRFIFWQDIDEAYINLNGEILELKHTGYSESRKKVRNGDRGWDTYTAGDVRVRIDHTQTKFIKYGTEGASLRSAIITVTKGAQKSSFKITGITSCC